MFLFVFLCGSALCLTFAVVVVDRERWTMSRMIPTTVSIARKGTQTSRRYVGCGIRIVSLASRCFPHFLTVCSFSVGLVLHSVYDGTVWFGLVWYDMIWYDTMVISTVSLESVGSQAG